MSPSGSVTRQDSQYVPGSAGASQTARVFCSARNVPPEARQAVCSESNGSSSSMTAITMSVSSGLTLVPARFSTRNCTCGG
ncbi:MAG: hypothetical protein Q9P14_15565 [candidate division KSB1 bacterium]|nr:hypothetical protein [candidate division KSB1 bacterium]